MTTQNAVFAFDDLAVPGFRFGARAAGIKKQAAALDLALLASDQPATAAGVFTQNQVRAAPVLLSLERIASGRCQAIIVNSGNANACTGARGREDAERMTVEAARGLGVDPSLVCVASTGVIGVPLPIDRISAAMPGLVSGLSASGFPSFGRAIMTTDKGPKHAGLRRSIGGRDITVAGVTKGAGMIAPNMATTLSFVCTDAAVESAWLRRVLAEEVDATLNSVTVDGDTSTNDSCFLLSSGASRGPVIASDDATGLAYRAMLREVLGGLARQLVRDGEGATRVVEIEVVGAQTVSDARKVAARVACSPLVKTAIGGADPNWGRVLCAVGNAGVPIDPTNLDLEFDGIKLVANGQALGGDREAKVHEVMKRSEYTIRIDLHRGDASARYWTCDLTHEYVSINADYRS